MSANPSQACGIWQRVCDFDATSGYYISSSIHLECYSYPLGLFPAVDPRGTIGAYSEAITLYNAEECTQSDIILDIYRDGQWSDLGNFGVCFKHCIAQKLL